MKSFTLAILSTVLFSLTSFAQPDNTKPETKVYVKSNANLGRFYLYVDDVLINRAPQIQVGVVFDSLKSSYGIRVVFQKPEQMPITGTIKPKKQRVKLYLLYGGTKQQIKSRKSSGVKEAPIPGDTPASHPAIPNYKGRLGCDYPIEQGVINQVVSMMTSNQPKAPLDYAKDIVTSQCLNTYQLKELLVVLPDDAERVELSKLAWFYLYDQENFGKLADAFTEPGQVEHVMTFVNKNQ